jgi:hypothetical protein
MERGPRVGPGAGDPLSAALWHVILAKVRYLTTLRTNSIRSPHEQLVVRKQPQRFT